MDRRKLLRGLGAGAAGLSLASMAWSEPVLSPSESPGFETSHRIRKIKIIGVGGAGCNFIRSLKSSLDTRQLTNVTELVCIDLGAQCLPRVDTPNQTTVHGPSPKVISLAPYGAGGRVNTARVAALRNIDVLNAAVNGAGTVVLVAGLGGGTGSGVSTIIARLARSAGAATLAAVVMPFKFEGARNRISEAAFDRLRRDANLTMSFSNQALGDEMGDGATLEDLFMIQQQRIAVWLTSIGMPGHTSLGPGNGLSP